MDKVFIEENGLYQIDFSEAIWAACDMHEKYELVKGSILKDVDWIAELENHILLVEYKNSNVHNANNPEAFQQKITTDAHYKQIAEKFYDSLCYLLCNAKVSKTIQYIYILECEIADSTLRRRIRNKIQPKLPFEIQDSYFGENSRFLLEEFAVLSIAEWNEQYSQFPITAIHSEQV